MVRKSIVWWGAPRPPQPDEVIERLAKFDHLMLSMSLAPDFGRIKALNPNAKFLFYRDLIGINPYRADWPEVDAHDDWFVKDVNGNRLITKQWGWYLLDITHPNYMDYYANYVKNVLDQNPLLDGVFADDAWAFWQNKWNMWTVPDADLPEWPTWHEDMIAFLRYIKSKIGVKLLIPNTQDPVDYANVCDGKFQEGWIHYPWGDPAYFPPKDQSLEQIDNLASLSSRGKYYLAHSGIKMADVLTPEELETVYNVMYYCLCCYLLGTSGPKDSFGWMMYHTTNGKKDHSRGYYPEMDVEPGTPRGGYYSVNPDIYGRDFDHAKVFVNFSDTETYEVTVEEKPYTLNPRSGIIAAWEAPPIPPITTLAWLTSGLTPIITVVGVVATQELKKAGVIP